VLVLVLVLDPGRALAADPAPSASAATPTATPQPPPKPRAAYNAALAALGRGDLEAAEAGLADARDRSGTDDELRFRASFQLALTYAAKAEKIDAAKPEERMAALRNAAAWLRDAVRLRPQAEDARADLEVILRRIQALADEVNRKAGGLEARL